MLTLLNIGCGTSVHVDWINMDASPSLRLRRLPGIGAVLAKTRRIPDWPEAVSYGNVVEGVPLPQGSCELVFASHVLEHLSLMDLDRALQNIFAAMRPAARLRLLMPDLEAYASEYLRALREGSPMQSWHAAHDFMKGSGIGLGASRRGLAARLRESASNARHQWLWDVPSMTARLQAVGFTDIRKCGFGQSGDHRFLEVEDESRHRMSFCLECVKP